MLKPIECPAIGDVSLVDKLYS